MADFFYCDELSWFGFPLNLLGGIAIVAGCILLPLFYGNKCWMRRISGIGFMLVWTAVLVSILAVEGIFAWKLYRTWFFIALWLVFLLHLGVVIVHRIHKWNRGNILFLLNHLGVWIAVAASLFGASDVKTLKMVVPLGVAENNAVDEKGGVFPLPFSVALQKFYVGYYGEEQRIPKRFSSELSLQGGDEKKQVTIEVNKPVKFGGYDLYLNGYDHREGHDPEYVVLQLVRDPWGGWVRGGIVMMGVGSLGLIIYGRLKRKEDENGVE